MFRKTPLHCISWAVPWEILDFQNLYLFYCLYNNLIRTKFYHNPFLQYCPKLLKFFFQYWQSVSRNSANFCAHSAIANSRIYQVRQSANCKSTNFYKYPTTLSQSCLKSRLFNIFCRLAEVLSLQKSMGPEYSNPQIKSSTITNKIGASNRKSAKCHISGRSANLTNYLKGQCPKISTSGFFMN